jgi:type VI secretion system secreted protein VgrG
MRSTFTTVSLSLLVCAGTSGLASAGILGSASAFAVLGGSTVTNTGPSVITGNLGVWPGTAITGLPPGIVNGTIHANDAVAQQAQADVTTAYNSLATLAFNQNLSGTNLGGLTLQPGVYFFSSSAFLTGTLTLDGMGDPNALFVFQIGSTLISASNSSVVTINSASACEVYWQVGSSATLGTDSAFMGSILALSSITLNTRASLLEGRALARNGAVTLDSNTITAHCIPTPGTAALLITTILSAGARRRM